MVVHEPAGRPGAVDKSRVRAKSGCDLAERRAHQYTVVARALSRAYERRSVERFAHLCEADQAESYGGAQSGRAAAGSDQASRGGDPIGFRHIAGCGRSGGGGGGGNGARGRELSVYSAIDSGLAKHLIQAVRAA